MKKYVIIGNGIAAAGCVEGIRSADPGGQITIVSAEHHPVYCRPLISYYLEGKTDLGRIGYRPANFYDANGCTVHYGRAVRLDPAAKTVALDDDTTLPYDALCVAAGSSPFVPPMTGLEDVPTQFGFLTLDDALALERAITPESRVLIVGAGLIGLKCAEGLHGRVASITVCDLADRVLSSILDPDGASVVQRHLESHGLSFLLSDSVARFEPHTAHMKSGAAVPFDVLVLAVGVRANTALVRDAGGACGRGITIDACAQTSLPGVYAAGDCTESADAVDGQIKVMALLPNAYMQGHCAGVNMAGGVERFDQAIPMNAIGFFGLHLMTAGSRTGDAIESRGDAYLKKLYVADGRLVGFELIGDVARAGIYTALIRNRTPLSDIDFELMQQHPTLAAMSAAYRKRTLAAAT